MTVAMTRSGRVGVEQTARYTCCWPGNGSAILRANRARGRQRNTPPGVPNQRFGEPRTGAGALPESAQRWHEQNGVSVLVWGVGVSSAQAMTTAVIGPAPAAPKRCGRARRRWAGRPSFVDQEHGLPGQRSHYLVLASVNRTALHHHVRASQQPLVPSARRPAAPRRPSASRPSPRRSTPSLRTSATRQRSVGSPISTRACSTATTQVGPSVRRSIERATTPTTRTESTRTRIEAAVLN
jgi:hypothetical protein